MRLRISRHLLGSSRGHDLATGVAAFGPQIDHPVGGLNHVEVVFDDQHGGSAFEQFPERGQQLLNIVKVQARGRLVEYIQDAAVILPRKMRGQFQALRLSAGKSGARLAEPQIAEAHFVEQAQTTRLPWDTAQRKSSASRTVI